MHETKFSILWCAVQFLLRLGISPQMTGFQYAIYGICLGVTDDTRCLSVMNGIYPEVAQHYQTSVGAVESGIRTILDNVWEKEPERFEKEFGCPWTRRPTAGEFLVMAVYCLKRDLEKESEF